MNDPHQILGLAMTASPEEIRRRYLQLVREFPPDRAPERFAEIRAAYDVVRDPLKLLEQKLFSLQSHDTFDVLARELKNRLRDPRLPSTVLLALAELK